MSAPEPEPTQVTPTGAVIPIPTREEVERALRRLAGPAAPRPPKRRREEDGSEAPTE